VCKCGIVSVRPGPPVGPYCACSDGLVASRLQRRFGGAVQTEARRAMPGTYGLGLASAGRFAQAAVVPCLFFLQ
jgi:hypothetical protein